VISGQPVARAADGDTTHRNLREGARAGLLATGVGALWSLGVDLVAGHPFRTWSFLGAELLSVLGPAAPPSPAVAVVVFLAFVALVFTMLGRLAVAAAHRADSQPSLIIFANTFLTFVTLSLVAFSTAFTTSRLGSEAWLQILGSPLIALWTLALRVYRTHPSLAPDFKRAGDA
jgi:FtsH-binding integral membrane protein